MYSEQDEHTARFGQRPLLVFWETTRSCPLACKHCRAGAMMGRNPLELDLAEAKALIDGLADGFTRPPILILTGGDPLMRGDLEDIVAYASSRGVSSAVSPSVSPALNKARMRELARLGVRSVSISLDGIGSTHDLVRGVSGHYRETLSAIKMLQDLGYRVQVNTTVMAANQFELAAIANTLSEQNVRIWEVFFLIELGRGLNLRSLIPSVNEDVAAFLGFVSPYFSAVRTVEGPFYRRILAGQVGPLGPLYKKLTSEFQGSVRVHDRPPVGAKTRDGDGILFISHLGEIYPSGFLPIKLGDVRVDDIGEIYRGHPLLRMIREGDLRGRCGKCDFSSICGGSRARAYARFGDPLGEDPACGYELSAEAELAGT